MYTQTLIYIYIYIYTITSTPSYVASCIFCEHFACVWILKKLIHESCIVYLNILWIRNPWHWSTSSSLSTTSLANHHFWPSWSALAGWGPCAKGCFWGHDRCRRMSDLQPSASRLDLWIPLSSPFGESLFPRHGSTTWFHLAWRQLSHGAYFFKSIYTQLNIII